MAIFTALLSTLGAVVSYQSAFTLSEAMLQKNESESSLAPHHRQAQAMTLIQIAISVASVTALTRQRWLFVVAGIAAAGGIGLWVLSLLP